MSSNEKGESTSVDLLLIYSPRLKTLSHGKFIRSATERHIFISRKKLLKVQLEKQIWRVRFARDTNRARARTFAAIRLRAQMRPAHKSNAPNCVQCARGATGRPRVPPVPLCVCVCWGGGSFCGGGRGLKFHQASHTLGNWFMSNHTSFENIWSRK